MRWSDETKKKGPRRRSIAGNRNGPEEFVLPAGPVTQSDLYHGRLCPGHGTSKKETRDRAQNRNLHLTEYHFRETWSTPCVSCDLAHHICRAAPCPLDAGACLVERIEPRRKVRKRRPFVPDP